MLPFARRLLSWPVRPRRVRTARQISPQSLTTKPKFDTLEDRLAPAGLPAYAMGAGAGVAPEVRVFDENGAIVRTFLAYDPLFTGGVRVAVGDLNQDGVADIVTSPGPGGGPHVRAFDGRTGGPLADFFAYDESFRGGVSPAVGPVGGGKMGIATGADEGGGPHVKVFTVDGTVLQNFMAFEESFRGGVHVSLGYARDGGATVFATPGNGGGPRLRSFDVETGTPGLDQFVFAADFRGGLAISAGDWTGDGVADAMTGAGFGGGPRIAVVDGRTGEVVEDFFAVGKEGRKGINPVAMLGPDGYVRMAAVASDPEPWVRVLGTRADDGKVVEVDSLGPFTTSGRSRRSRLCRSTRTRRHKRTSSGYSTRSRPK